MPPLIRRPCVDCALSWTLQLSETLRPGINVASWVPFLPTRTTPPSRVDADGTSAFLSLSPLSPSIFFSALPSSPALPSSSLPLAPAPATSSLPGPATLSLSLPCWSLTPARRSSITLLAPLSLSLTTSGTGLLFSPSVSHSLSRAPPLLSLSPSLSLLAAPSRSPVFNRTGCPSPLSLSPSLPPSPSMPAPSRLLEFDRSARPSPLLSLSHHLRNEPPLLSLCPPLAMVLQLFQLELGK